MSVSRTREEISTLEQLITNIKEIMEHFREQTGKQQNLQQVMGLQRIQTDFINNWLDPKEPYFIGRFRPSSDEDLLEEIYNRIDNFPPSMAKEAVQEAEGDCVREYIAKKLGVSENSIELMRSSDISLFRVYITGQTVNDFVEARKNTAGPSKTEESKYGYALAEEIKLSQNTLLNVFHAMMGGEKWDIFQQETQRDLFQQKILLLSPRYSSDELAKKIQQLKEKLEIVGIKTKNLMKAVTSSKMDIKTGQPLSRISIDYDKFSIASEQITKLITKFESEIAQTKDQYLIEVQFRGNEKVKNMLLANITICEKALENINSDIKQKSEASLSALGRYQVGL